MWTNTSLPPSSLATKPKPLASSNHLTLPLTATAVDGSGARAARRPRRVREGALRPLDDARRIDFDDARHLRALGAGADRHRSLAPAGTVSWPEACSALACRKASPWPPASSTKP